MISFNLKFEILRGINSTFLINSDAATENTRTNGENINKFFNNVEFELFK